MAPAARNPSPAAVATKSASVPARARSRSKGRSAPGAAAEGPAPAATAPGAAPPMPTLSPETIFVPSTAKQERAKVASRSRQKRLRAKNLAEEAAEGAPTTKRVRIRVGTGRPRGRPRKKPTNGDEIEVPASSSKTQAVAGEIMAAAKGVPRVRVIPLGAKVTVSAEAPKRGRGRPVGSLGVVKRAQMAAAAPGVSNATKVR